MTDPEQGDDRRGAMAGLIFAVVLLAVGIWLARDLTAASKMQDCLMSGRTNCNTIEPAR
jgi:Mn2+/Fe2+ NRAMP family transporter